MEAAGLRPGMCEEVCCEEEGERFTGVWHLAEKSPEARLCRVAMQVRGEDLGSAI